jgi:hypothetical protein
MSHIIAHCNAARLATAWFAVVGGIVLVVVVTGSLHASVDAAELDEVEDEDEVDDEDDVEVSPPFIYLRWWMSVHHATTWGRRL